MPDHLFSMPPSQKLPHVFQVIMHCRRMIMYDVILCGQILTISAPGLNEDSLKLNMTDKVIHQQVRLHMSD